jgi:hypothetical protein
MRQPRTAARWTSVRVIALMVAGLTGCDRILPQREDTTLPPIEDVQEMYRAQGVSGEISYSGNVVEMRVMQPRPQLERGGSLWARVGPYVYLFSPATRDLFAQNPGVAAVRAITATGDGEEVARALLLRDTFGPAAWQRTLNLLGLALRDGTQRPTQLEALVDWGERHTEHTYNPNFVPLDDGGR